MALLLCPQLAQAAAGEKRYNMRLGNVFFNLSGTFDIEYNDNLTSSGVQPLRDLILKPGIILDAEWRSGGKQQFEVNLGMNYSKHLRNSQLDSAHNLVNFDRDSQLKYTVRLRPLTITLRDVFSLNSNATDAVAIDPQTQQLVRNVSHYSRFDNKLIVDLETQPKNWSHKLSLSRQDVIPFQSEFSFTRRTEYAQTWTTYYTHWPVFVPGVQAGLTQNRYAKNIQNDSHGFNYGPLFQWKVSQLVTVSGSAVMAVSTFKDNGSNQDTSNSKTLNLSLQIQHVVNRYYTHSLRLTQSTGFGFVSNTTQVRSVEYSSNWRLNKRLTLKSSIKHETSKDSGGLLAESFRRISFSVGFEYLLFKFGQLRAELYHSRKISNYADRSFPNTRLLVGIKYDI
jgi:hypothetical protein